MTHSDSVLERYHGEMRRLYILASVVLLIFSVVMYHFQDSWASPILFSSTLVILWAFHWNSGRRIRSGTFGASMSFWSRLEQVDLRRWLDQNADSRVGGVHTID